MPVRLALYSQYQGEGAVLFLRHVAPKVVAKLTGDNTRVGVVLVHGLTGTPVEMRALEKLLLRQGFEVENVLLAGHGAGHQEMLDSTWQQWLQSVRSAVRSIKERADRIILCGLSMGAMLCAAQALDESDKIAGVIMMSPTLKYDGSIMFNKTFDALVWLKPVQNSMRYLVGKFPFIGRKIYWEETPPYGVKDQRLQKQITKSIEAARAGGGNDFGTFRTYYGSLWQMWELVDRTFARLEELNLPVLLISSMEDSLASIHNATKTYLKVGSRNKCLVLLTGCDHVMTLDLQKNLVQKLVMRFAERFGRSAHDLRVRDEIAPALAGASSYKNSTLSLTLSPEVCALSEKEWRAMYPDHGYPGASACDTVGTAYGDTAGFHSLVARDAGEAVLNIPVIRTDCKVVLKGDSVLPYYNPGTLSMGAYSAPVPNVGVGEDVDYELYVNSWRHSIAVFESLGKAFDVHLSLYTGLGKRAFAQLNRISLKDEDSGAAPATPLVRSANPVLGALLARAAGRLRLSLDEQSGRTNPQAARSLVSG